MSDSDERPAWEENGRMPTDGNFDVLTQQRSGEIFSRWAFHMIFGENSND